MKFGEQLRSSVIREYQWYYIDYDGLKGELKSATGPMTAGPTDAKGKAASTERRKEWSEDDEERFVRKLEGELEKVHQKQQIKAMEISRRIAVSEKEVDNVVGRLNERGPRETGPSEEEFMLLEEALSDIIADVHDLAKFVQLNYTGFHKIIKKHDLPTMINNARAETDAMSSGNRGGDSASQLIPSTERGDYRGDNAKKRSSVPLSDGEASLYEDQDLADMNQRRSAHVKGGSV